MSKYLVSVLIILGLTIPFQESAQTQQVAKSKDNPYIVSAHMNVDPGTG